MECRSSLTVHHITYSIIFYFTEQCGALQQNKVAMSFEIPSKFITAAIYKFTILKGQICNIGSFHVRSPKKNEI